MIVSGHMTMFSLAGTIADNFYLSDFFDVAIVAIFVYSALLLFKQTRSFHIVLGLGMIVLVYVLAQVFDLYLTGIVLQSFFSVFIVVLVIVFQEELRRFFEFIAAVGTRQIHVAPLAAGSDSIAQILQSISYLVHNKIGALIVLPGQENIDRHLEGGNVLDGIISEELIESIFDPTSPGHDGAIIVHKDRITQIGVHLPLSNNFPEIGKHGTRHSAALGIAERSDAFAIILSEEQGTISLAHKGRLETLKSIEELAERLTMFLKETAPERTYGALENLIKTNSAEKVIAVVIAALLWFFVAYRADTVQRDFVLPITYRNVPDTISIEEPHQKTLTVRLESRGRSAFDRLEPNDLEVSIDASTFKKGRNSIEVRNTMIHHPLGFTVLDVTPSTIQVNTIEPAPKELDIPQTQGGIKIQ